MSATETFQIGRVLYTQKEYYHCAKWMQATQGLLDRTSSPTTEFYSEILDYQSFCYSKAGNMQHALKLTTQILNYGVHNDIDRIKNNYEYYKRELTGTPEESKGDHLNRPEHWNSKERDSYEKLCQIGKTNAHITHDGIDENLEVRIFA